MAQHSGIEWTESTWNPVRGCSRVSQGCVNCYAERMAARLSKAGQPYHDLTDRHGKWNGVMQLAPEHILHAPLRWRKAQRIFVNSMSDLFHEKVADEWIDRIFAVMALTPWHTYQVLTKRPARMLAYLTEPARGHSGGLVWYAGEQLKPSPPPRHWYHAPRSFSWPLPNVWLGVSVEDQAAADERVPLLLQTPAAVRFVSAEPLLGPVNLGRYGWLSGCDSCCNGDRCPRPPECTRFDRISCPVCKGTARGINVDWVIVGGESGPGARPMDPSWARSIRDQCLAADIPFFFKQWGGRNKKKAGRLLEGRRWNEMPQSVGGIYA